MSEHPLRVWRDKNELTQEAVAELIGGVSPMTVSRWERGRLPRKKFWPKIRAVTGLRPSELGGFQELEAAE